MKAARLEGILEEVKQGLNQPIPAHTLKEGTKMAKKVEKKGKSKDKAETKKSNGKSESNLVTLADLAKEAKSSGAAARRKIRASELDRGDGRWAWEPGSKQLKTARSALGL